MKTSASLNMRRNGVVRYRRLAGRRTENAIIKAITGGTLTLWLPSSRITVTTAAQATTHKGVGWVHRV